MGIAGLLEDGHVPRTNRARRLFSHSDTFRSIWVFSFGRSTQWCVVFYICIYLWSQLYLYHHHLQHLYEFSVQILFFMVGPLMKQHQNERYNASSARSQSIFSSAAVSTMCGAILGTSPVIIANEPLGPKIIQRGKWNVNKATNSCCWVFGTSWKECLEVWYFFSH